MPRLRWIARQALRGIERRSPCDDSQHHRLDGSDVHHARAARPSVSDFTLVNTTDVLGPSLCPVACSTPPCMMNPPVFLARIAGSLTTGTFESKLYVAFCTSEP
jgi:hypothetical protein